MEQHGAVFSTADDVMTFYKERGHEAVISQVRDGATFVKVTCKTGTVVRYAETEGTFLKAGEWHEFDRVLAPMPPMPVSV